MLIKYSKNALKYLARADKQTVKRIRAAIEGLTLTPPEGDIKILQGYSDGRQRLRVFLLDPGIVLQEINVVR